MESNSRQKADVSAVRLAGQGKDNNRMKTESVLLYMFPETSGGRKMYHRAG
jgi:hypothetical protein